MYCEQVSRESSRSLTCCSGIGVQSVFGGTKGWCGCNFFFFCINGRDSVAILFVGMFIITVN